MSLIPFIAIARKDENGFLLFTHYHHTSSQTDKEERIHELNRYQSLAIYKLNGVNADSFVSIFPSQIGKWFVKSIDRQIFTVVTSDAYPVNVAVEIVDELYETFQAARKILIASKRKVAMNSCCSGIAYKYGTLKQGSAAHVLTTQVDKGVRLQYSKSIHNLVNSVEKVKEQLNDNIQGQLKNIESAERLQQKSAELVEQAEAFKKKAKSLTFMMWLKKTKWLMVGTAAAGTAGGVAGFLIGGHGLLGMITGMASVASTQICETSTEKGGTIAGYIGAYSPVENWFWNQKYVVL